MNRGFTLVELLVVIAMVAVIGVVMLAIFTNTLRGSHKAQVLSAIKQNGQAVLEAMDRDIRNADNVVCATSTNLVIISGGDYTRYRFITPTGTANGLIQQDNPTKQIDPGTGEEETEAAFSNRVCNPNDPMTQTSILTDTNSRSGVSVASGSFERISQPGSTDDVTITINIGPPFEVPPAISSQIDPVAFQTTVHLRPKKI